MWSALRIDMIDPVERSYGEDARWVRSHKGKYHDGMRCGFGSAELLDGSIYHGDWQDDLFHGMGHLLYSPLHREAMHNSDIDRVSDSIAAENPTDFDLPEPGRGGISNIFDLAVEVRRCTAKLFIAYAEFQRGHLHGRVHLSGVCRFASYCPSLTGESHGDPPSSETTYSFYLECPLLWCPLIPRSALLS